ncbi:Trafficking protein particle complex subunit 4 [Teratosphaeria destructans]|uniref:Trafficking protein particle complex subunit n=1 Tax=Teratosphaeria destructans TaxID=418781 RepID=A0A9W7SQ48_9PEZI|nr:Trafficking protein particle complex subunit 4 [Teratosphaeria destructans]
MHITYVCMVVFALLIINKAGGLIYNRTFAPGLQSLSGNDYLILAGTFHGIHAISRSINPAPNPPPPPADASTGPRRKAPTTGIESLESSHFRLTCFQTPTGVKFLLFTSPEQPNADVIVRRCYELYGDSVMKNPCDRTNPQARSFWWSKLKVNYYDNGIKNFRIDQTDGGNLGDACENNGRSNPIQSKSYPLADALYYAGTLVSAGKLYP